MFYTMNLFFIGIILILTITIGNVNEIKWKHKNISFSKYIIQRKLFHEGIPICCGFWSTYLSLSLLFDIPSFFHPMVFALALLLLLYYLVRKENS